MRRTRLMGSWPKPKFLFIGKLVSKDQSAYTYLPESVAVFPDGQRFLDIFEEVGFKNTECKPLTFGISSIYIGQK